MKLFGRIIQSAVEIVALVMWVLGMVAIMDFKYEKAIALIVAAIFMVVNPRVKS